VIIAGFDPGITSPGIGLIRPVSGGFELLFHKVVRTKSTDPLRERLNKIFRELSTVLVQNKVDGLAIEEQRGAQVGAFKAQEFNADNSKTLLTVGVAIGCALAYGVPWLFVRPQESKCAVLGRKKGSAEKAEVQAAILRLTGVKVPQDAADAGAHAIAGSMRPLADWRAPISV
jgi:Holliday junction resolvasome RuvABC endonuclease subunit